MSVESTGQSLRVLGLRASYGSLLAGWYFQRPRELIMKRFPYTTIRGHDQSSRNAVYMKIPPGSCAGLGVHSKGNTQDGSASHHGSQGAPCGPRVACRDDV